MLKKLSFLFVSLLLVVSSLASGVTGAASAQSATFKDISNHWAKDAIMQAVAKGYVQGYPDGTFKPDNPVQADEFIKMFILALSGPSSYPNRPVFWTDAVWDRFDDVTKSQFGEQFGDWDFKQAKSGYWAKPYIDVANVVLFGDYFGGNSVGIYNYSAVLKRQDVAKIIYMTLTQLEFHEQQTYAKRALWGYKDLSGLSDQQKEYIAEVMAKGIMGGYNTQYFGVNKPVTRAEALAIIQRFIDKSQRKPANIDLTNVPHVVVPVYFGTYQKTIVFQTQKQLDVYTNALELAKKYAPDRYEEEEGNINLFKDNEQKQILDYTHFFNFDQSVDGEIEMDIDHLVYYIDIFVSEDGMSYDRQKDLVQDYLVYLIGDQESNKIMGEMLIAYNKLKDNGIETQPFSRDVGNFLVTVGSNSRVKSVGVTLSEFH